MSTCFPFIRYLFFVAIFMISAVIIKTSTTLEVVGFNVLNIFAALFGISIAIDVMEYTLRPTSKHKVVAYIFSAGAILMFVGILLTTIGYDKMVMEYASEGEIFKLDESYRDLIESIKNISITTIALTFISSIVIFYKWDDLRYIFDMFIDPLLNTRIFGAWILRVLLCFIAICLGFALLGSEEDPDVRGKLFMPGVFFPTFILFMLFFKNNIKYWVIGITGLIMLSIIGSLHRTHDNISEYVFNRYEKPLYGVIYVLASLSILELGSIYATNFMTGLFKIGLPLATLVLSSYLVYLGSQFFQLTRHHKIR